MTIAAAYLTSEGVVLGADSTTTIMFAGGQRAQLINHAQKVFEVGRSGRIGLCTYGDGTVGGASHRSIAARLGDEIAAQRTTSITTCAEILLEIVGQLVRDSGKPITTLGYLLGGVVEAKREAWLVNVEVQGNSITSKRLGVGPAIAGSNVYFSRVFHGYDPRLPAILSGHLAQKFPGVDVKDLGAAVDEAFAALSKKFAVAGWDDLPIREAIDFVHTYLHLTIKAEKFRFGWPACGGPLEVAFITTDREFRWARHKTFDSAIVEQQNSE